MLELKNILTWEGFRIDRNLLIVKSRKDKMRYSTPFTLMDLGYDAHDIVDRLRELSMEDYSETLVDRDDGKPPLKATTFIFRSLLTQMGIRSWTLIK